MYSRIKNKIRKELFKDCKTIIVASGQKVGSTWLFDILSSFDYFKTKNIDYYSSEFIKAKGGFRLGPDSSSYDFLTSTKHATIIKTHNSPPIDWKPDSKVGIVSIHRDPRDVIISTINYLSWLPVEKGGWGNEFAESALRDKYMKFMSTDWHLNLLENWHDYNHAYKVSYEELLANPVDEVRKLLNYHSIPFSEKELHSIITEYEFKKQKKKAIDSSDKNKINFLSKGKAGQWQKLFDDAMKDEFKQHLRWNNMLIEQGYEKSNDW